MRGRTDAARLLVAATIAGGCALPVSAHDTVRDAKADADGAATAVPAAPNWIVTLSTGILARDEDAARPFLVAGVSRRIGRGYVRVSATRFRSVVRQVDAALPSDFTIGSIGGGGTFGQWFVDAYASAGRQDYGGVTTPLGTRPSQIGTGSAVYGAAASAGRFVALTRRLYLTPSAAVQYSANRTLRSTIGMMGPRDYETSERAWTGSANLRLDRFFGRISQHIAGVSVSRVQTSNGAVVLAANGSSGLPASSAVSVADGWFVAGASTSLQMRKRLWLDAAATRTLGASAGDVDVLSLGVRIGLP